MRPSPPVHLASKRLIRVTPLKGARAEVEGRVVLVAAVTARAVAVYLRARRYHRLADSGFVWLGLRNGGPLDGMGLYRMLRRRAEEAGYEPAVHPHMFRAYLRIRPGRSAADPPLGMLFRSRVSCAWRMIPTCPARSHAPSPAGVAPPLRSRCRSRQ